MLDKRYLVHFKINNTMDPFKVKQYVKEEKNWTKLIGEWLSAFKANIKLVLIDGFEMEF